jgi:hypothetical protein
VHFAGVVVMAESKFELASFIDQVAQQLLAAEAKARGRGDHVMQFEECELEMAVSIDKDGRAGIKVWVLELGAGAKKTDANTIRVKFKRIEGQQPVVFFTGTQGIEPPPVKQDED